MQISARGFRSRFAQLLVLILLWLAAVAAFPVSAQQPPSGLAKAAFAAGCFWCTEEAMDKVPGVISTTSGYMGGSKKYPTYEEVSTGTTGHTEVLLVVYDPAKVSYERLLEQFWVNHDPIVSPIERASEFWPAEDYHPCRLEHPILVALQREGFVPIYGLNYKDRPEDAALWLDKLGDPYKRTGADIDGRVGIDWGVYGVPQTFVIDSEGRIAYTHVGPLTSTIVEEELRPRIRKLRAGSGRSSDARSADPGHFGLNASLDIARRAMPRWRPRDEQGFR